MKKFFSEHPNLRFWVIVAIALVYYSFVWRLFKYVHVTDSLYLFRYYHPKLFKHLTNIGLMLLIWGPPFLAIALADRKG